MEKLSEERELNRKKETILIVFVILINVLSASNILGSNHMNNSVFEIMALNSSSYSFEDFANYTLFMDNEYVTSYVNDYECYFNFSGDTDISINREEYIWAFDASKNITDLDVYHKHVEQVYNLQTFYGDETLKALLSHSKAVSERVKDFTTLFSQIEDEEPTDTQESDLDDTNEEREEAEIPEEKKHVFYAGTRRRNN